jgi:hypothetical protein
MASSLPSQGSHPCGAKFPAKILISPMNGSAMPDHPFRLIDNVN